jgi:ABC-type phosphate/phosphonate transport system substrate-binding protein
MNAKPAQGTGIASLGMYEFAETRAAFDALWREIAAQLDAVDARGVPPGLTRGLALSDIWHDPQLLLAQTCGYPLLTELAGQARLVATPVYDVPGCSGPWHRSFIVVRVDSPYRGLADLRGAHAAVNGYDSNSGMNLFRAALAPVAERRPMFAEVTVTGSHAASAEAVMRGDADVAAIDCVSYWFIARENPQLAAATRVLTETPLSPSLPLITNGSASDGEVATLRRALRSVVQSLSARPALAVLRISDFVVLDDAAYEVVLDYERQAVAAGYPRLE